MGWRHQPSPAKEGFEERPSDGVWLWGETRKSAELDYIYIFFLNKKKNEEVSEGIEALGVG